MSRAPEAAKSGFRLAAVMATAGQAGLPVWRLRALHELVHRHQTARRHLQLPARPQLVRRVRRFHVLMDDGQELELGPGDAHLVGPGHDAWVVGDEPCVTIDFIPAGDTAGGRILRCPRAVEFRVATEDQLDHLVATIREHAKGSHDHELTREQVLAELGVQAA